VEHGRLVIAALVVCGTVAGALVIDDALTLIGIGAAAVAFFPFVYGARRRGFDPFEPIYAFVAYNIFNVLIRGWVDLRFGSPVLDPRFDVGSAEFRVLMSWVFGYTGLFLSAFIAGYYSKLGPMLAAPLPALHATPLRRMEVWLAVLASLVASLPAAVLMRDRLGAAVAHGDFLEVTREGGVAWISYLLRFAVGGAALLVLHAARQRGRLGLAVACLYALVTALVVFSLFPSKIVVANTLLLILGGIHYLRHPVRVRAIVLAAVCGLVLVPLLMTYRRGLDPAEMGQVLRSIPAQPQLLIAGVFQRSYGADSFALILDGIARGMPIEGGRTFGDLLWWWVPRAFWPDKPTTYAIEFWNSFMRQSDYFPQFVSASPSVMGELYLNFWWPGLVVGGLVMGWFYRAIYSWFARSARGEITVLLYVTMLAGLTKVAEGPIADHIEETAVSLGVMIVLVVGIRVLTRLAGFRSPDTAAAELESHAHRV
jgi:hypothetical protein